MRYTGIVLTVLSAVVSAQRFAGSSSNVSFPGTNDACAAALETVVQCPSTLLDVAQSGSWMTEAKLTLMCTSECRGSLQTAQAFIRGNCSDDGDVIVDHDTSYPATYMIDHLLHTFDKTCMKDPISGQFCDPMITSWLSEGSWKQEYDCHECYLGLQRILVQSPFGYREDRAAQYAETASTCGFQIPEVSPPTPYAINRTTPATQMKQNTPVQSAECETPYEIKAGDDCTSIAIAQNVSTNALRQLNGFNPKCSVFPAVGHTICLPKPCATYVVQEGQTCWNVMTRCGRRISNTQLVKWNPRLHSRCTNMPDLAGEVICVSAPGKLPENPLMNVKAIEVKNQQQKAREAWESRKAQCPDCWEPISTIRASTPWWADSTGPSHPLCTSCTPLVRDGVAYLVDATTTISVTTVPTAYGHVTTYLTDIVYASPAATEAGA